MCTFILIYVIQHEFSRNNYYHSLSMGIIEACRSKCIAQNIKSIELIIVDNASTNETRNCYR